VDVAEDDDRGLRRERVEDSGRAVGRQQHVRLIDRLPSGDRGAVEHHAFVEEIFGDRADMMRQMLPLAARIGEAEIDVFGVVLLDHLQDFFRIAHRTIPFAG